MDLLTIIFTGRSGCGKGTQVKKLKEYLKSKDDREIFHLEAGDRFRSFINEKTYASKLASDINDNGGLQPEFLSVWAWVGELVRGLKPNSHLFIDGTPRRLSEAKTLESAFEFFDRQKVHIVYLSVSKDWAIDRMQERGRTDDTKNSNLLNRMKWFEEEVVPVLDFYRSHKSCSFHDINGEQSIDEVYASVVESLGI